ncbi:MAG: signal peptidase II [Spirochaetaceae bacterium]|nr:signal peptidase II [Spirochaetaceae bacterium]
MNLKNKLIPFSITFFVILVDQITKYIVVKTVPLFVIKFSFFDEFLRIVHVRNKAIAFSIGSGLPDDVRTIAFSIFPLIILILLIIYIFRTNEFTIPQRWFLSGIIGGGFGNLIDRFFRPDGVVDFIDVKFFGIFGLERWPTFNVADSAIVVCGILLFASLFFKSKKSPETMDSVTSTE